jgi:hypothetical protein
VYYTLLRPVRSILTNKTVNETALTIVAVIIAAATITSIGGMIQYAKAQEAASQLTYCWEQIVPGNGPSGGNCSSDRGQCEQERANQEQLYPNIVVTPCHPRHQT